MTVSMSVNSMRTYILTDYDKKIIRAFLENDLNLNGFNVLKLRLTRALPRLEEDLALIRRFLEKA